MPTAPYTLSQAESDIAELRGLVDRLGEVHTVLDGPVPNAAPSSGIQLNSQSGNMQYLGADGNNYDTGRMTVSTGGSQTIASTSYVTVAGGGVSLQAVVVAATYHFRFHVWFTPNGTGTGGNALFRMQGPAFTLGSYAGEFNGNGVASGIVRFDNTSGFNVAMTGPALTASSGIFYRGDVEGLCTFTAGGTLLLQSALSGAATTNFTIATGSFLELFPVT